MDKDNPSTQETAGLTFPCSFGIKVFGLATLEFKQSATDMVRRHAPDLADKDIIQRSSKDGKYIALTLTINARSREQLDAIYQDLTKNPLIIMAL